jgi:small-conductance mechanosensitive channel
MTLAALEWPDIVTGESLRTVLRILALVLIGFPVGKVVAVLAGKVASRRFSPQSGMIVRKIVFYGWVVLLLMMILNELGFQLASLLAAAGIAGIAIGFAAQTSVSNIISGVFLISERPFQVGDLIQVGETVGVVLSIDLLSAKVRAFDNRYIRIPNETLIKTEVINYTNFPLRRVDLMLGVAYRDDVQRVEDLLRDVARSEPLCLDEPEPVFVFRNFGDSALELQFSVWAVKEEYLALKNLMMKSIKLRFDEEGIEIPFPHRTIYTGSETSPMPVRLEGSRGEGKGRVPENPVVRRPEE